MIHLTFEKPNLQAQNPNNAASAKKRQDAIDKAKAEYIKNGGKITKL